MNSRRDKIQMTVRLKPEVYLAAKEAERRIGVPLSVIVAEAAGQSLLPPPAESPDVKIQNMANRLLSRMETLERALGREMLLSRELLAQFARAYFNHTPAIPDSERSAASTSGRVRFVRMVEQVSLNVRQGVSILEESKVSDG